MVLRRNRTPGKLVTVPNTQFRARDCCFFRSNVRVTTNLLGL
jgi:hypothetical protein